jgi:hypothetical protein
MRQLTPMAPFTEIHSCRICGHTELVTILSLGDQCLTGVFPRNAAESVTRGPLDLVKCVGGNDSCGLVQLKHSYDSSELYGNAYGYRSSLNQSMVDHLRRTVEHVSRVARPAEGDCVLDIGSNDGTTLSFYPASLHRIGFDPTAEKFREFYEPGIRAIARFFSAAEFDTATGGQKATVVTSIAMLYDLDQPLDFARQVASILAEDGIWYFEQSYMPLMLSTTGYDTICHEHLEYYGLSQIYWILERAGLRILDVSLNDINGGSFAVTACRSSSKLQSRSDRALRILAEEHSGPMAGIKPLEEFALRVRNHRDALPELLARLTSGGAVILGYGASTKGNVILQYCEIGPETIPFFAEVNRDKFGAYTPGSGIPIISETEARARNPDFFLVMPWHFRRNLLARESDFLATGGQMIFPLPQIEVVSAGKRDMAFAGAYPFVKRSQSEGCS